MKTPMLLLAVLRLPACSDGDGDDDSAALLDGGLSPDAATELGPCPDDSLCLAVTEVVPGEPIGAGRLVVVWRQLLDVGGIVEVPKIAYEGAFEPGAARYVIPLTNLVPPDDNQLMCQWDDKGCHRDASPEAVGFGLVMVVDDKNTDGFLASDELSPFSAAGGAFAYVVWSERSHAASSDDLTNSDGTPNYKGAIFPSGLSSGFSAYNTIGPDENFDFSLRLAQPSQPAELAMCPTTRQCQVAIPRLVGAQYP